MFIVFKSFELIYIANKNKLKKILNNKIVNIARNDYDNKKNWQNLYFIKRNLKLFKTKIKYFPQLSYTFY